MIISVINQTNGQLTDDDVQTGLRAINRQIAEDFEPYWGLGAKLRLEGRAGVKPKTQGIADMRGDAVLYLWNKLDIDQALGYHLSNNNGIPYGFVFTTLLADLGESWTATLSHETLELIADPEVNLLVMGPHPGDRRRTVFHWYEMCDAVQDETYKIEDVEVSNFVLPLYFTGGEETGGRNDFLGRVHDGLSLPSFGVNPGGYVNFYDPVARRHRSYSRDDDAKAKRRRKIKGRAKAARRGGRHEVVGAGRDVTEVLRRRARAAKARR